MKLETKFCKKGYFFFSSIAIILVLLSIIPNFLFGKITPPVLLGLGLTTAFIFGTPQAKFNQQVSKKLLQWSVVGLGFNINLYSALASGSIGMSFTILSVFGTLIIGMILAKWLGINKEMGFLISSGTAICGGSAIATIGTSIRAKEENMTLALSTIFLLNAFALFIFPPIGKLLHLNQEAFGFWSAIAIHDTSSVIGASATYGEEALKLATTIKLTRSLWIVPLAFLSPLFFKQGSTKFHFPYFILYFIIAILFNTFWLEKHFPEISNAIAFIAQKGMLLAMFFIGASLSLPTLQKINLKPFLLGILLWFIISIASLLFVIF